MAALISRRAAKHAVLRAAPFIGVEQLCRGVTRALPRICMYHRFTRHREHRKLGLATFEAQLDAIARHFKVVPMREVGRQLAELGEVEPNLAVITVDDGYADFHTVAAPALRKRGLSATFYITTEFLRGEFWLWPDRLEHALQHTRAARLDCLQGSWPTSNETERRLCWSALVDICVNLPTSSKDLLIDDVVRALDVTLPARPPDGFAPLSLAELRELASEGIEIGAHTRTHPILSRSSDKRIEEEVRGSKTALEESLQRPVVSFCYPNGRHIDIGPVARQAVRAAGFTSAVAAYFAHDVLHDPFEIKRYGPGDDMLEMRSFLAGFEHLIDRRRAAPGVAHEF